MKVATAPINWNNEDVPGYRKPTPYPQLLDEIVAAGYDATEWSGSLPDDPDVLRPALKARGLSLLGAFVGMNLRDAAAASGELARARAKAAFLHDLGGRYLVVADAGDAARVAAAGHAKDAPKLTDAQLARMASGLNELGREVGRLGMELVFHPHVGTYVETPDEIDRLLQATEPGEVGWCLDTGHQVYGGADLRSLISAHRRRIRYVHVKDVDPSVLAAAREEGWSFHEALERFVFCRIGTGLVPMSEVLAQLRDASYDGWLVIEQDTTPDDPTVTARDNRERLEGLLARA